MVNEMGQAFVQVYYSEDDGSPILIPLLPLEGLIRIDTVLAHYQVSKTQLYQEIADGSFPKQRKHGRSSFWDAVEFRRFLRKQGATVLLLKDDAAGKE